jgi:autoinducer 2-degrading protein
MTILVVQIQVKREHIEAFRLATIDNANGSRREPGVARFDFMQQTDDPTHFLLYEAYREEAALAAHRESAHYKVWAAKTADMFAEPRTRQIYRNVDPPDSGW